MSGFYRSRLAGIALLALSTATLGQGGNAADSASASTQNQGTGLRRVPANEAVNVEGLIRLDVVVTDSAGKAVQGLKRTDFKVLENGVRRPVVAFRAPNQVPVESEDGLRVILLIDTIDLGPALQGQERRQTAEFLRRNSGKLTQPVTIYSLEKSGLFLTAGPSTDGELLAKDVAADTKTETFFVPPKRGKTAPALYISQSITEGHPDKFPAMTGLRALGTIATREVSVPGRKLLLWIGPGLGYCGTGGIAMHDVYHAGQIQLLGKLYGQALVRRYGCGKLSVGQSIISVSAGHVLSGKNKEAKANRLDVYNKVKWFSALLRQARLTVDCLAADGKEESPRIWERFVNGNVSPQSISWMNLYKKVLAVQSGGRALPFAKNRARQIEDAIQREKLYYALTFDPFPVREEEYHSIKVEVDRPNLTARTSTGFFDEPYYDEPPDPTIRHVTIAQLEQLILFARAANARLPRVALTERLSATKIQQITSGGPRRAPSKYKRRERRIEEIAYESAFLDPPSLEILADPPPDKAERARMLAAAAKYMDTVIKRLPDFYATRHAIDYFGTDPIQEVRSTNTVLYRHGDEMVVDNKDQRVAAGGHQIYVHGTFGPILRLLQGFLTTRTGISWKYWEKSANGRRAVFGYEFRGSPVVSLVGCCFPNGVGGQQIGISSGSHGEIVIDPSSGAVLRIQLQNDLAGFVPTKRSDVMVRYGPVHIGGKTYIVPVHSVTIRRARTVKQLTQWGTLTFATWGPYKTTMEVINFDHYHYYSGTVRILPGYTSKGR